MLLFAVELLGALGFLVPLGKRCQAVWQLGIAEIAVTARRMSVSCTS